MSNSHFSRRHFIKSLGIAGGVSLLGTALDVNAQIITTFPFRKRCPEPGAIIRKSFKTLSAAELAAYKNGVAVMQARPLNDPTSWGYQAAIHGTFTMPAQTAWNTCEHGATFFLSWHRMYLCFFERILRKASGLPSLGLPYWNYSDSADPNARQLPAAFRTPALPANPLFTTNRNASINAGALLSASAVNLAAAIPDSTNFFTFSGNVQGTPHNVVHGSIGGWMGAFETAGQDPIFWLHHCNIDRLWNRWLSSGGGRQNPITDAAWLYTPFTFFDENGKAVKMTGADLINSNCSMCKYCYDEETISYPNFAVEYVTNRRVELLIGATEKPIVIGNFASTFDITLNGKAKEAFATFLSANKAGEPVSIKMSFDEARADKPLDFYYEVYINLPKDVKEPNFEKDNYAGNISFFGIESKHSNDHEKTRFSVYISEAIKKLSREELNAKKLSITLVPTGLVSPDGKKLPIRSDAKADIGRITLTLE